MDLIGFHKNMSEGKFEQIIQQIKNKKTNQDDIFLSFAMFWSESIDEANNICQQLKKNLDDLDPLSIFKLHIIEFLVHEYKKDISLQKKLIEKIEDIEKSINFATNNRDDTFWKGMLFLVKGLNNKNINSEAAIDLIDKSILEFQQSSHKFLEANAYFKSAQFFETLGKYSEAIHRFETAIQIWEKMDLLNWMGLGTNGLGLVHRAMGEYDKATEYFEKAIKIFSETINNRNLAISLKNMGIVNYFTGKYRRGIEYYSKSKAIFEDLGDKEGISATYGNMAIMYTMLTEYPEAEKNFKIALNLEREMKNTRAIGKVSNNLGNLIQMQGKFSQAMEYYNEARICYNQVDDKNGIGVAHHNTAFCYNVIGETRKALEQANAALEIRLLLGNEHLIGRSYNILGEILYKIGDMEGSVNYLEKSLDVLRKIGNAPQIAETGLSIVEAYIANNQIKDAEVIVLELKEMAEKTNVRFVIQISKYVSVLLRKAQYSVNRSDIDQITEFRNEQLMRLDEILSSDPHTAGFEIEINLQKIEILLSELSQNSVIDKRRIEVIQNVEEIVEELQLKVEKENNYDLQIKLFILQAKMSRYLLKPEKTIAYLETAASEAADKELNLLAEAIELEKDHYYMEISVNKEISNNINDFERFIHYIKKDISQFYENTDYHYYRKNQTLCGLTREELQRMEIEYNIPKTTISKCSKCRQKLYEDALHNPIVAKIISKACSTCAILPEAKQAEQIVLENVQRGNLVAPNYREGLTSDISVRITWKCVNPGCDETNEIVV